MLLILQNAMYFIVLKMYRAFINWITEGDISEI